MVGSLVGNVLCLLAAVYRQLTDATIPPAGWINEMHEPIPRTAQPG